MRTPIFAGLLAVVAAMPAVAAPKQIVGDPGSVPSLPLRPPVAAPAPAPVPAPVPAPQVMSPRPQMAPSVAAAPPVREEVRSAWHAAPPPPGGWRGAPAPMPQHPPRAPNGWSRDGGGYWSGGYRAPVRGYILPSFWLSPTYVVGNWSGYGLDAPGRGRNWVRYYDDAVLVDGRGKIYDSARIDWDRYDHGDVPRYAGDDRDEGRYADRDDRDYDDGYDGRDGPYAPRWGHRDGRWGYYEGGVYEGGTRTYAYGAGGSTFYAPPGYVTTIVVQSQPVVTTTTTYEYVDVTPARSWKPRAVAKPKVRYRPKPKPRCVCGS